MERFAATTLIRRPRMALTTVVLVGALLCLLQYAARASYWHDEAFLVLNVMDKTAAQLMGKLDHEQAAPPLFLLALRACYVTLGGSEFSLRLPALMSALVALPIFAWTSHRIFAGWLAIGATALLALSDELIFQSATVKQYSGDVLVACVLLALAVMTLQAEPDRVARRFLLTSIVAAAAAWASHPAVFIFGGVSLALLPSAWSTRGGRFAWIAGNAVVVASFVLLYFASIRLQHDPRLYAYWIARGSFPDYSRPWMLPPWMVVQLVSLCNYAFEPMGIIVMGLATAGAVDLWRERQWPLLAMTLGPIALTLLAACALQFPFGGSRVTLFLTPGLVILVTAGMRLLPPLLPSHVFLPSNNDRLLRCLWLAPAALAAWCVGLATYHVVCPRIKSHMRPAVAYVREHRRAGDAIYILGESRDDEFYSYWRHPEPLVQAITGARLNPDPHAPFWIVTGFNPKRGFPGNIAPQLEQAADVARETERYVGIGGAAIRFNPKLAE